MAQADLASAGNAPHLNQAEQDLLLSALKSNQTKQAGAANGTVNPETAFNGQADSSAFFEGLNDTSFLDSHFDTGNLNWDLDATGLDELNDNDNTRTSSHFDDGDDDDEGTPEHSGDKRKDRSDDVDEEGGKKRRESMEKVAKKPGRKPMTNEPTSKRKAQNRAAQRAFRERKEKHLRDLEQKVEDLEKTSEATNHENGVLRAKVDRLQAELTEYKKQIGTARPSLSPNQSLNSFSWDIGQNLDFEFPKFGIENNATNKTKEWVTSRANAAQTIQQSSAERKPFRSSTNSFTWSPAPFTSSRSMSTSTGNTYFGAMSNNTRSPTASTEKSLSNSESPASLGLNSSVCTTPESTADSPGHYKNADHGASTNSVDFTASVASSQPKTPGNDGARNIDWFTAQNNNGLFDPILIDAYREPQDNILNNADLNLSFFDDAFPWNPASGYGGPFSGMSASGSTPGGQPAKASLMDEVEQAAEGKDHDAFKRVGSGSPAAAVDDGPKHITCAKLWERVQRSEKVLNGQADMDDLCMQLKAKAKCGGPSRGAIVDEADVDAILGPDPAKAKATGMLSMFS